MIYLAPFIAEAPGVFRPDVDGDFNLIDFTPPAADAQGTKGLCIVRCEAQTPKASRVKLTDYPLEATTAALRRLLGNKLGVTLEETHIPSLLAELLLLNGDDKNPSRWNRLKPGRRRSEIWLGELIWEQPVIAGGATYSETWPGADSDSPNGTLTWTEVAGDWDVISHRLQNTDTGGSNSARAEHDLASSNHSCQADVSWLAAATNRAGPAARFSGSAHTCYVGSGNANNDTRLIHKAVAGTYTSISSVSQTIGVETLLVKTTANASTVSVDVGAGNSSITDTAIAAGTRFGVAVAGGVAKAAFANVTASDLVAAVTAIAPPLSAAVS